MAYVVSRPGGRWELRESLSTPRGSRSRTLASFRTLTQDVIDHALARSSSPLTPEQARRAAHRAGAPVAATKADEAAAVLIRELDRGRPPRPVLARALHAWLNSDEPNLQAAGDADASSRTAPISHNARAAAAWAIATSAERGAALRDLLLLADRLPKRAQSLQAPFPRLDSSRS